MLRHARTLLAVLSCAAAAVAVLPARPATASPARKPASRLHTSPTKAPANRAGGSPQAVISVPLTGGTSALYSSYQAVSGSAGGVVVAPMQRSGDGLLGASDVPPSVLPAGRTSLSGLHPTYPSGFTSVAFQISGWMVTDFEADYSTGASDVWWDDIALGKSALKAVSRGWSPVAATPNGFLMSNGDSTALEYVDLLTGKTSFLTSSKTPENVTAGPDGAIVIVGSLMEYVTYSPAKTRTLATTGNWECESATSSAGGCDEYNPGSSVETIGRFPLGGGRPVTETVKGPDAPVLVTPKVTAWVTCGSTSCTLRRVPWAGGAGTSVTLSLVTDGANGVQVVGDSFSWGQLNNDSPNGGLFDMSDSATRPSHVVSAPLSPVEATNVSVSGNTVSWIDNAEPGLGVWTRSLSGSPTVTLGKPSLVAQAGFVYTDAGYGLGLGTEAPGPTVVYSTYQTQPTSYPLALRVRSGRATTEFSTFEYAVAGTDVGPPVDISGNWVLYQCFSGWYLYDTSTHVKVTLPSGVQTYALGGGDVAWVDPDGSVWEEAAGTVLPTQLAGSLPSGESVDSVNGLAVDGSTAAWSYTWSSSTKSGSVADFVDPAVSSAVKTVPDPSDVFDFVLSTDYLGFELYAKTGETIDVIDLPSGTSAETLVTHNSFALSMSGKYAAWIGGNSLLPFVGAL